MNKKTAVYDISTNRRTVYDPKSRTYFKVPWSCTPGTLSRWSDNAHDHWVAVVGAKIESPDGSGRDVYQGRVVRDQTPDHSLIPDFFSKTIITNENQTHEVRFDNVPGKRFTSANVGDYINVTGISSVPKQVKIKCVLDVHFNDNNIIVYTCDFEFVGDPLFFFDETTAQIQQFLEPYAMARPKTLEFSARAGLGDHHPSITIITTTVPETMKFTENYTVKILQEGAVTLYSVRLTDSLASRMQKALGNDAVMRQVLNDMSVQGGKFFNYDEIKFGKALARVDATLLKDIAALPSDECD